MKISSENIKNLIYTIRGKQVMLDSDVAMLYHYETKKINQTVKRNINRFPEKFCFRLTKDEFEFMWSQIVTTSKLKDNKYRSVKYLPYVFTKQGIAMLSGKIKIEIFKSNLYFYLNFNFRLILLKPHINPGTNTP